jgi:hypothetical protein
MELNARSVQNCHLAECALRPAGGVAKEFEEFGARFEQHGCVLGEVRQDDSAKAEVTPSTQ